MPHVIAPTELLDILQNYFQEAKNTTHANIIIIKLKIVLMQK